MRGSLKVSHENPSERRLVSAAMVQNYATEIGLQVHRCQ